MPEAGCGVGWSVRSVSRPSRRIGSRSMPGLVRQSDAVHRSNTLSPVRFNAKAAPMRNLLPPPFLRDRPGRNHVGSPGAGFQSPASPSQASGSTDAPVRSPAARPPTGSSPCAPPTRPGSAEPVRVRRVRAPARTPGLYERARQRELRAEPVVFRPVLRVSAPRLVPTQGAHPPRSLPSLPHRPHDGSSSAQTKKAGTPRGARLHGHAPDQSNQCTMPSANISTFTPAVPRPVPEMPCP